MQDLKIKKKGFNHKVGVQQ